MAATKSIHWLSPALMVISLLSGLAFAIAHHILHAELNGCQVDYKSYNVAGFSLSQQQTNIAAGTALAFLGKVCLIISVSIAYTQVFWSTFGSRRTQLRTLDTLHDALGNPWMATRPQTWWRYPTLISFALIAWLIPMVSIVTPSTLSIALAPLTSYASIAVPQLGFESLRFINPGNIAARSPNLPAWTMDYRGPNILVEQIARSVASSGSILSIPSPRTNASWVSTFAAPYLECKPMAVRMATRVEESLRDFSNTTSGSADYRNFLAWTASEAAISESNSADVSWLPYNYGEFNTGTVGPIKYANFVQDTAVAGPRFRVGWSIDSSIIPVDQTATLYLAAIPNWTGKSCGRGCFSNSTFLTCEVLNTTHNLGFNFTNNDQDINITFPELESAKPVPTVPGFYFNNGTGECSEINESNSTCVIDPVTLQKLSYQGIMDAFGRVLVGSVRTADVADESSNVPSSFSTTVLATPLIYTPELNFLASRNTWHIAADGLFTNRGAEFDTLFDWSVQNPGLPLAQALEQMFQNITISMLSSPSLYPNASSTFAPPLTNVTFSSFEQVYIYSIKTLWLSYGLAIALALLAVSIGMKCVLVSGASFSDDFATILRAARNAEVDVEVEDARFCDPLPKELAEAVVSFDGLVKVKRENVRVAKLNEETRLVDDASNWWPQDRRWMPVFARS